MDFSEIAVPNVTSVLASPLYLTATHSAGTGSPSIAAHSANGYLDINPGTTADAGYNIQANVANVPGALMQFYSGPDTNISTTRDIYWGIRCAFKNSSTWDGKVFMGLSVTDTAVLVPNDGTISQTTMDQGIGFHIVEGGVISLVSSETTVNNSIYTSTVPYTMASTIDGNVMYGTGYTNAFHDFFFHAHWETVNSTSASCYVTGYLDGRQVAHISGASKLPDLTATDLFNTIEVRNGGAAATTDMAIAEIINAVPRYHL